MRNKNKNKKNKKKSINRRTRLAENTLQQMDKIYYANLEVTPQRSREEYEYHRKIVYNTINGCFDKRTPETSRYENPFYGELVSEAATHIQLTEINLAGILSAKQWRYASDSQRYASMFMKLFYYNEECEEE